MYACLAVTCHLHFWQNDRDFLRATAVTRGWNGYRNKSQHRKSTLEKKILPPFQQGFEPATFQSRVRCSNHWAIPAPQPQVCLKWRVYMPLWGRRHYFIFFGGCMSGRVYVPCIFSHAWWVTVGNLGLCCCVCVMPFERQLTLVCWYCMSALGLALFQTVQLPWEAIKTEVWVEESSCFLS